VRIHLPELRTVDGQARLEARVELADTVTSLWWSVEDRYARWLNPGRLDAFLVALLLRAMQLGEDVELLGPVSTRLHMILTRQYMTLMAILNPDLRPVTIHAAGGLDEGEPEPGNGVGTGFSAGIDSFGVVHDWYFQPVPPGWKITHFLFNNVGSHGDRDHDKARELFRQRYAAVRGFPDSEGLDFIAVDSNLAAVLPLDFEQTHTTRNLAAALLFQRLFRRYYYASTFSWRDLSIGPTFDIAFADPVGVNLLSTETLEMHSAGGEHTRVEKTRRVATLPAARRWLNVCGSGRSEGGNCSACLKCCRTLYTLELLGQVEEFGGVFDLDRWRRVRNRYIVTSLLGKGRFRPLTREVLAYARAQGVGFTPWQHLMGLALRPVPKPLYRLGRSIRRRWFGGP
jgi:hypothetical protein